MKKQTDKHDAEFLLDLCCKQSDDIEKLVAALRRCIPADGEVARMKHEALLRVQP